MADAVPRLETELHEALSWLIDKLNWSQRKVTLVLYLAAAGFGSLAWLLQSVGKLLALLFILFLMGLLAMVINKTAEINSSSLK